MSANMSAETYGSTEYSTSNRKHKREVCRYWLNSRCAKGQACEFLHVIDYAKMPICPMGDSCGSTECTFRHLSEYRPLCANYQLGFCSFGRRCAHRHEQKPASALPQVSDYWTSLYAAIERSEAMLRTPETRNTFRKKTCEYFQSNGWCPYFDMCNFKH